MTRHLCQIRTWPFYLLGVVSIGSWQFNDPTERVPPSFAPLTLITRPEYLPRFHKFFWISSSVHYQWYSRSKVCPSITHYGCHNSLLRYDIYDVTKNVQLCHSRSDNESDDFSWTKSPYLKQVSAYIHTHVLYIHGQSIFVQLSYLRFSCPFNQRRPNRNCKVQIPLNSLTSLIDHIL